MQTGNKRANKQSRTAGLVSSLYTTYTIVPKRARKQQKKKTNRIGPTCLWRTLYNTHTECNGSEGALVGGDHQQTRGSISKFNFDQKGKKKKGKQQKYI
jgi:hypothetical protein